ncbi:MAG: hypothetical protein JRH20_29270, partial [Deltaproteobacteria bacterium]|nr:hypothetical protein [Deltaproteobacteria bacterium]
PLKWWSGKAMAVEQFSDGSVAYGGFVKGLQTFGEGETHETTVGIDTDSRTAAVVRFFP